MCHLTKHSSFIYKFCFIYAWVFSFLLVGIVGTCEKTVLSSSMCWLWRCGSYLLLLRDCDVPNFLTFADNYNFSCASHKIFTAVCYIDSAVYWSSNCSACIVLVITVSLYADVLLLYCFCCLTVQLKPVFPIIAQNLLTNWAPVTWEKSYLTMYYNYVVAEKEEHVRMFMFCRPVGSYKAVGLLFESACPCHLLLIDILNQNIFI